MATVDIKTDKLTRDIHRKLVENCGKKYTAAGLAGIFGNRYLPDSHDPLYRRVLKRLNWLYENGYIEAFQTNRYTPIKWWVSKERFEN